MKQLIQAVKEYAAAHYEDGGWDVIAECWGDSDIEAHIKGAKTEAQAIALFKTVVSVWADRQADARNSAF